MHRQTLLSTRRWRATLAAASLLAAPLMSVIDGVPAAGQERVYRSVTEWRERIPDEADRPRYKERWTHRGYELVNDQITVVATTNVQDARLAAAEATSAWKDASELSDQFTGVHRERDFGIGALQIVIDGEPQRDRDQPLTTLNVVGQKCNLVVHVSAGQPQLAEQAPRLREAAVLAFLRTAELDLQFPAWVCQGLASYIAEKNESPEAIAQLQPEPTTNNVGGQQWRQIRQQQDLLGLAAEERADAIARVRFFLEGNDSAHTPDFFAALRESAQDVARRRVSEGLVPTRQGEVQVPIAARAADELFVSLKTEFAAWQQEPLAGQPLYRPAAGLAPEVEELQREMALVLKLQRRFTGPARSTLRTKIVSFKKEPEYIGGGSQAPSVADPRDVFQDLTSGDRGPWATRDIDGSLLLSSNVERIEGLFGDDGRRFSRQRTDNRWVLTAKLPKGRLMHAWLEDNKGFPSRPEVKFEFVEFQRPAPVIQRIPGK